MGNYGVWPQTIGLERYLRSHLVWKCHMYMRRPIAVMIRSSSRWFHHTKIWRQATLVHVFPIISVSWYLNTSRILTDECNFRILFYTWRADTVLMNPGWSSRFIIVVRFPKIKTRPRSGVELVLSTKSEGDSLDRLMFSDFKYRWPFFTVLKTSPPLEFGLVLKLLKFVFRRLRTRLQRDPTQLRMLFSAPFIRVISLRKIKSQFQHRKRYH